jgi:D-serine deaminase-like pyridoxal phosphate-dependent protein
MAVYFADHGWRDICIAFPVNILEWEIISALSKRVTLHVIVDHPQVAQFMVAHATSPLHVWIDVDTGYGRTGIPWDTLDQIMSLAQLISTSAHLHLEGILTHAGESYACRSLAEIIAVFDYTLHRMKHVQDKLKSLGYAHAISLGDTPTVSKSASLDGIDEIRPGNLALYDLTQWKIASCSSRDIAIAVACPVVSKYDHRHEILIHGGGIHFSKDRLDHDGEIIFGRVMNPNTWDFETPHMDIVRLCQEHGSIRVSPEQFEKIQIGDILHVFPVHSCMVMDLFFGEEFTILP